MPGGAALSPGGIGFLGPVAGGGGSQGTQGSQGAPGAQGAQGSQGGGFQGAQGATGSQGFQGAQGRQGAQGAQGNTGNTGSQGAQGFQGAQGSTGSQGNQGAAAYTFTNGLLESPALTVSNTFFTGAAGGQTLFGGTAASDPLVIRSTTNATPGITTIGQGVAGTNAVKITFTPDGSASAIRFDGDRTVAAGGVASSWNMASFVGSSVFLTGATTTTAELRQVSISGGGITSVNAQTVTTAATVKIGGSPTATAAGGSTPTITNKWALWVNDNTAGDSPSRFDSRVRIGDQASDAATVPDVSLAVGTLLGTGYNGTRSVQVGAPSGTACGFAAGQSTSRGFKIQWKTSAGVDFSTLGQSDPIAFTVSTFTVNPLNTNAGFFLVNGLVRAAVGAIFVASATAMVWDGFQVSGTFNIIGATGSPVTALAQSRFQVSSIAGDTPVTVTDVGTVVIDGSPTAGANVTITRSFSMWSKGGKWRIDGQTVAISGAIGGPATLTPTGIGAVGQPATAAQYGWFPYNDGVTVRYFPVWV